MDQLAPVELAPETQGILAAAAQKLRKKADAAKVTNDPFAEYFDALAISAESQLRLYVDGTLTLNAAADRARRPVDVPALTEAVAGAARGAFQRENVWQRAQAAEAARHAARKELLRWSGITAGLMALSVLATGVVMSRWQGQEVAALQESMDGVQRAAFGDGNESARNWTALMSYNHVHDLLGPGCRQVVVDGRRGCDTRVWVDPPPQQRAQK